MVVHLEDETLVATLEAWGYRVKTLPDHESEEIGAEGVAAEEPATTAPEGQHPPQLADAGGHYVVQLTSPPSEPWVSAIEDRGLEVVEPMSTYSLFVFGPADRAMALSDLPFVRKVGQFRPAQRISPNLLGIAGTIRYASIGVYPPHAVEEVADQLRNLGADVRDVLEPDGEGKRYGHIIAELDSELVGVVAALPLVRWVERVSAKPVLDGEREAQIVAENLSGSAPIPGYAAWLAQLGLSGQGVTVAICDTGVSRNANNNTSGHLDLRGRQAAFVDYTHHLGLTDTDGHGTHVAGIAVGNAASGKLEGTTPNVFRKGQGVAPGASYVVQNAVAAGVRWPPDWHVLTRDAATNGALVMNNSWGNSGPSGGYTAVARRFDQLVRNPRGDGVTEGSLIVVFSAGNDGPLARTITPPKEGKNTIVVGNSLTHRPGVGDVDDIRGIRRSSSRGPARDGRLLPNLVAPGTDVLSARAGTIDGHLFMTGTSAAAPHVTGACALIIEHLRRLHGGADPSAALVKALLVNGAEDLAGGPNGQGGTLGNIPDNEQGWGRVSLQNIFLDAPRSDRGPKLMYDQQHALTAAGQEVNLIVAPVDTARPLRITLAWTDAPGAANAGPALVNDLDLEVVEVATGQIFKGNVFANGFSTSGGAFDRLNNVECVYMQAPQGSYEINIVAGVLRGDARPPFGNGGWQDFSLVVDNATQLQPPQLRQA